MAASVARQGRNEAGQPVAIQSGSRRRRWPLQLRLYAMALLVAVPAGIYVAYDIAQHVVDEFRETQREMLTLAQVTAIDTSDFLEESGHMLTRFARRMVIGDAERGDCALVREFSLLQARFANMGLANLEGTLVCTSMPVAQGRSISVAHRGWFTAVMAGSPFAIGEFMIDLVTGSKAVAFGVPVRDASGTLSGALGISLSLAGYQPVTAGATHRPGSIVALVDGDGLVVSSSIQSERLAGTSVRDAQILEAVSGREQGVMRAAGFDGIERVYGFSRIDGSDWYALAGLPVQAVRTEALAGVWRKVAFMTAIIVLLGTLSWRLARGIERPVRAIAEAAREVAAGKLDRRIAVRGLAEVEDVARALNEMLDVRTSTEAALRESEAQRAGIIDSAMDAIVTVDDRQIIVIFNKAAERMFRCPASASVGEPVQRFVASSDRAAYRQHIDSLDMTDGKARSPELLTGMSALRADGETFPVEVTVSRTIAAGRTLYTVILRDITERKRAQQQIENLAANLEKRVAERTLQLESANTRLQLYARELAQLGEISQRFQGCTSLREAACAAAEFSCRLVEAGGVFLLDASRNLVESASSWGGIGAEEQLFRQEDCLALVLGKPVVADGSRNQPRCRHVGPDVPYLCMPLVAQGETFGILHLRGETLDAGTNSAEDRSELLRMVQSVTERTGLALGNLKLRETLRAQSIRDPLTHLYNRRFLEETLEMQESLARRKRTSIGLMMIDVDHFKAFNDTHGHDAGDHVLGELAKALQAHTRAEDIACRYGGEELCVVLPGASPAITRERADQLRRAVAELRLEHDGLALGGVTISIGVASYPEHGGNWREVLRMADAAMYQAKHQGRNRVALADAPSSREGRSAAG